MEMAQLFQRTLLLAEEVSGLGVSVFFLLKSSLQMFIRGGKETHL